MTSLFFDAAAFTQAEANHCRECFRGRPPATGYLLRGKVTPVFVLFVRVHRLSKNLIIKTTLQNDTRLRYGPY